MNEEWVPVTEDLPQLDLNYHPTDDYSVVVLVKLSNGMEGNAIYSYARNVWYNTYMERIRRKVVAWQSL